MINHLVKNANLKKIVKKKKKKAYPSFLESNVCQVVEKLDSRSNSN